MKRKHLSFLNLSCLAGLAAILMVAGCQVAPTTVLRSDDIPVGLGTSYEAFQNNPGGETAQISLDSTGPWDFSKGPDAVIVNSRIVKLDSAADHDAFPGAKYAEKVFPSKLIGSDTAYNFAAKSDSSLSSFGQSVVPKGQESVFKSFTKSERILVFPLRVGDKWTDSMSVQGEEGSAYEVAKEVVARGEVDVPAGKFFDCFMIRITKTTITEDSPKTQTIIYTWWAPDVGLVAAAGSNPDEKNLYFDQAAYLFRLKSYTIKD